MLIESIMLDHEWLLGQLKSERRQEADQEGMAIQVKDSVFYIKKP